MARWPRRRRTAGICAKRPFVGCRVRPLSPGTSKPYCLGHWRSAARIVTRRRGSDGGRGRTACRFGGYLASDIHSGHRADQRLVRDGVVVSVSGGGLGERGRRGPLRHSRLGDGRCAFHAKARKGDSRFSAGLWRAHHLVGYDPSSGRRRLGPGCRAPDGRNPRRRHSDAFRRHSTIRPPPIARRLS